MNELKSCKYNRDNGFVELRFVNGTVISIDCNAVEDDVAETILMRLFAIYVLSRA